MEDLIFVFYEWMRDDEGGYGICKKDDFDSIIDSERGIPGVIASMKGTIIFEFKSYDEFVTKFVENGLGNNKEADYYFSVLIIRRDESILCSMEEIL